MPQELYEVQFLQNYPNRHLNNFGICKNRPQPVRVAGALRLTYLLYYFRVLHGLSATLNTDLRPSISWLKIHPAGGPVWASVLIPRIIPAYAVAKSLILPEKPRNEVFHFKISLQVPKVRVERNEI